MSDEDEDEQLVSFEIFLYPSEITKLYELSSRANLTTSDFIANAVDRKYLDLAAWKLQTKDVFFNDNPRPTNEGGWYFTKQEFCGLAHTLSKWDPFWKFVWWLLQRRGWKMKTVLAHPEETP